MNSNYERILKLALEICTRGACLSWGRWEDHGRSSGKWWSGVKIGESGAGCLFELEKVGRACGESWAVVEWQGNGGKWSWWMLVGEVIRVQMVLFGSRRSGSECGGGVAGFWR
nr:hypothetical protein [Tanacetum cinerariifolium]